MALVIVALAFGYGFRSLSGGLERLGRDQRTSAALSLAQSTLDRVGYDIAFVQGNADGNTGEGFRWSARTTPYISGPRPPAGLLGGYVVSVVVAWKERDNVREVRLSTVRLAPAGLVSGRPA